MPDLSQLLSEAKSLPDEVLQKELSSPTGMIPGYIALGELQDRQAIRGGGTSPGKRPNMVEELLQNFKPEPMPQDMGTSLPLAAQPQPVQGFSEGGILAQTNPFLAFIEQLQNPEARSAMVQDKINQTFNGTPPLMPLQRAAGLQPIGDNLREPMAPGQLQKPPQYHMGGIASLIR